LLELVNSTIEDVGVKQQLNYKAVLGGIERRIRAQVEGSVYTKLGVLGLDEIALKKGHRNFGVIVTARLPDGRVVILGVLPNRLKETVVAFLRSIPERLRETIHTVCTDMYDGYIEAVREVRLTTRIVVDRYHVTEKYHEAADVVRKQELKRLKAELSEEEYQLLKGNLWAFRKKPEDLKPEERQVLDRLFSLAPKLKLAYALRQQLTDIFEEQLSKEAAKLKIQDWIERVKSSELKSFDDFLKTLMNWWEEITNYFVSRANSGFVEGLCPRLLKMAGIFSF
jgi:transposase